MSRYQSAAALAMFCGVREWRCSNMAKYIGKEKVEGSIHGSDEFIF